MAMLLLSLAAYDQNAPIHAMAQQNIDPYALPCNPKEIAKPDGDIILISSHYIQNFTAHLVFSRKLDGKTFTTANFVGDNKHVPTSVTQVNNVVNVVFPADVTTVYFTGFMGVPTFKHPIAWRKEDPGHEFFEREEFNYINTYRKNKGVPELFHSQKLQEIARVKAMDLIITAYNHNSPTYGDPKQLQEYFQYTIGTLGENIAMSDGMLRWPNWFFYQYRMSPDHHKNMVEPRFTAMGVGFAYYNNKATMVHIFSAVADPDELYGFEPRLVLHNEMKADADYVFAGDYADPDDTNWGPNGKPSAPEA